MGRIAVKGLDFFPVATSWENEIKLLKAKYGRLEAVGFLVEIWASIYHDNYYRAWNDDAELLFADEIKKPIEWVHEIVEYCFSKNIFDRKIYESRGILTSHGIQKRYFNAAKSLKRDYADIIEGITYPDIIEKYRAEIKPDEKPIKSDDKGIRSDDKPIKSDFMQTQSKQSKAIEFKELASGALVDNFPKDETEKTRFYAWALKKAKANPRNRNAAAVAKTIMKDQEEAKAWRDEDAAEIAAHWLRYPEPPACSCGGKIQADRHEGVGQCKTCEKWFHFDTDRNTWTEDPGTPTGDEFDDTG